MSAQENAEAFVFVIKKLGKWSATIISILILIFLGALAYETIKEYYTYGRHKKLVKVETNFNKELCDTADSPLFIAIINNSTKKVKRAEVEVIVTKKGRSTKLNDDHKYINDVILKPSEGHGFCYTVYDDNLSPPQTLNGEDMEVNVSNYNIVIE